MNDIPIFFDTDEVDLKEKVDELVEYIRNVNGILGAVDGDTIKAARNLVSEFLKTDWKLQECRNALEVIIAEDDIKNVKSIAKFCLDRITKNSKER